MPRFVFLKLFLLLVVVCPCVVTGEDLVLPTPLAAYEGYNPQTEALLLFGEVFAQLEPAEREAATKMVGMLRSGEVESINEEDVRELLSSLDWESRKPRILRLMVYQSGALGLFGDDGDHSSWQRFIHDFLLFFLSHLPQDRLADRLVSQLRLIGSEERGDRLVALIDRTPSLQKIGQIVARNPQVPEDLKLALQTLENGIGSARRDDVVAFIEAELGASALEQYQMKFADELLAEASVGAVVEAQAVLPGETEPKRIACKIIKPYVVRNLRDDLEILGQFVLFLEDHAEFYGLGEIPLEDLFAEARDALSREIQVVEEQRHLREAWEYYKDDPRVDIPEIYSISTTSVTVMEFVQGGKIVDGFPGNVKARKELAKRLDELLTIDVIFSSKEVTIFHGDPHPGNVFYLTDSPEDPYRIAFLDWGLRGELSRQQRQELIQLVIGVWTSHRKRLRNNVGVLIAGGMPDDPQDALLIRSAVDAILKPGGSRDAFQLLGDLIAELTTAGYQLNFDVVLFIKAQITITGMLLELAPDVKRSKRMGALLRGRVTREMGKRFLYTIYPVKWTSRDFPTMLSNADISRVQINVMGRGFRKFGRWFSSPFRKSKQ